MAKVYFTKTLTPEAVVKLYGAVGKELGGRVAIKVHSGEAGNQNFLKPEFWKPMIDKIGGTVVECNTAYDGERNTDEKHEKLLENHGWTKYFKTELLDAGQRSLFLNIPDGKVIKANFVGAGLKKYDSLLVLSHFKGHPMGGYGGALKQLSIGIASSYGKAYIHGAGEPEHIWDADHDKFLESMADAAHSVVNFFSGKAVYINVMANMSVDCDCCAIAEDPCIADIGILASDDPVAIDRACLDIVNSLPDSEGKKHFLERVNSRNGAHTIDAAAELGVGSKEYELIEL
ncbi:MAG: DUF362 domain-containing protein [Clostridiales bacterium]|nr:DUF362 domain-containing protein [Candidatus Coliplasma equi]